MKRKIIFFLIIGILFLLISIPKFSKMVDNNNSKQANSENIIVIEDKEIELNKMQMMQENNETSNNEEIVKTMIANKKILDKEVEKRNISLSKEEVSKYQNIVKKAPISEENKKKIDSLGMSEEEFRDYLEEEIINMQLRVKLKTELIKEINSNSVKIENVEFKKEVDKYNKNKDAKGANEECLRLVNKYIELLQNNYIVKEKNN